MRKAYQKPLMYAEGFTLLEHISAGCAYPATFGNDCKVTVDGITFFTSVAGCNDPEGFALLGGNEAATLEEFYAIKMRCYNSFVDFTTGQFFAS